jgi:hypothetical protein
METSMGENLFIFALVIGAIYLVTQRWFWVITSGLCAVASFFAMCASVIHFQILGAMGFFILTAICSFICGIASDS